MTDSTAAPKQAEAPWWAAFPAPQSECRQIEADEIRQLVEAHLLKGTTGDKNWLLVDVRRTDWEGGTVATSINLPAHTLYQTRAVVYDLCRRAGVKRIFFYCGASNGRGPRCAGWMQDYIKEVGGEDEMESQILKGGIKGWVKKYNGELVEHYEASYWDQFK